MSKLNSTSLKSDTSFRPARLKPLRLQYTERESIYEIHLVVHYPSTPCHFVGILGVAYE
jgi:hypothetical protein